MSYNVLRVERINDKEVSYYISSCDLHGKYKTTDQGTIIPKFDAVFIAYHILGVPVFYDITKKTLCIKSLNGGIFEVKREEEADWINYIFVRKKLTSLFEDHWPSLGEIADVRSNYTILS